MRQKWIAIFLLFLSSQHFLVSANINETVWLFRPRKPGSDAILKSGKLIRAWGEINSLDTGFSSNESYLYLCTGLAIKNGLAPYVLGPVRKTVEGVGFASCQNRDITRAKMPQLFSEWGGRF